jgi:hypothetical protein
VANAGAEPSVVLNKVSEAKSNFGYNAQTDAYGDMMEMGVIDPTKVTRYALQNAASVAGLILTTDAMVGRAAEEGRGAGHAPWRRRDGLLNRFIRCRESPASAGLFLCGDCATCRRESIGFTLEVICQQQARHARPRTK